ncbi:MAG: hypothetical protein JW820_03145 [Spirochaetales bacterium]|nr:hypothetical protein [Spirochaetales bacterium]
MSDRARLRWPLLALLAVAILAAGFGTWGLVRLLRRERPQLSEILREADRELSEGRYLRTRELLEAGFRTARGETGYLRLLKRALQMAEMTAGYGDFARWAREAAGDLPGSRRLAAVAAYGVLRSGSPEDAAALLEKAPAGAELDGLAAEAHLRGLLPHARTPRLGGTLAALAGLPALQEPAELHTLGELLQEPRLALDAALLWAEQGRLEEAYAALWAQGERLESLQMMDSLESLVLIAFDAGKYREAWELLEATPELRQLPEQRIFRADLAWLLGLPERAADYYQGAIQAAPGYSWIPYLNLAALMDASGDQEGAQLFRGRAFEGFPEQNEVVLAYARDLAQNGRRAEAREALGSLLAREPGQVDARLLLLELENTRGSPALYQGRMWELFNRNPANGEVAQSLGLYLLGIRDLEGVGVVLREYGRGHGEPYPPWHLELQGALALRQGEYASAAALFRQSVDREDSWRRRYNLAVALGAAHRHEEALQELILSETRLAAAQGQIAPVRFGVLKSRVRSRIAECHSQLGDHAAARREALYALDLDPGNQHARRVLRILEGLR